MEEDDCTTEEILDGVCRVVVEGNNIIRNPDPLELDYFPKQFRYRGEQVRKIGEATYPILAGRNASNVLICGPNGTGKSAVARAMFEQDFTERARKKGLLVKICYVNYKFLNRSPYNVIVSACKQLGIDQIVKISSSGLDFGDLFSRFVAGLDKLKTIVIFIFDEIDECIEEQRKYHDNLIYALTRMELSNSKLVLIGIANNINLAEEADKAVLSTWQVEAIYFSPFHVLQVRQILQDRAKEALYEGVVSDGTIGLCAALATQKRNGDLRLAVNLLRVAAEEAVRRGSEKIEEKDVREAYSRIEYNRSADVVRELTKTAKIVLISILALIWKGWKKLSFEPPETGSIYDEFKKLCGQTEDVVASVSDREVRYLLEGLDEKGIIERRELNKGRFGRTSTHKLLISQEVLEKVLIEDPVCKKIIDNLRKSQQSLDFFSEP